MIKLESVCNSSQLEAFENFERIILDKIDNFNENKLGGVIDLLIGKHKVFGVDVGNYLKTSKDKFLEKPLNAIYGKIDEFEQLIYPIMLEDGKINAKALNAIMHDKKPFLYNIINLPKENFILSDIAEQVFKGLAQLF
jgi:hypothetical protein